LDAPPRAARHLQRRLQPVGYQGGLALVLRTNGDRLAGGAVAGVAGLRAVDANEPGRPARVLAVEEHDGVARHERLARVEDAAERLEGCPGRRAGVGV